MMVLFVSRSEKKALQTVRRILDNFADRVGNDTWKTVITADGLATVKTLLRKTATKNTAVACHWIRSRHHSELVWIVGDRTAFNEEGIVPVHTTQKNLMHFEWENDWQYLPALKSLTAMASLLHDWGKASDLFQLKLKEQSLKSDPYRHEWVSCKLIEALVQTSVDNSTDTGWLSLLDEPSFNTKNIYEALKSAAYADKKRAKLAQLPPIASMLVWLILSHHRLPDTEKSGYYNYERSSFTDMLQSIDADWGYTSKSDDTSEKLQNDCFTFAKGLLCEDACIWRKYLKKWSKRLLEQEKIIINMSSSAQRALLIYSRTCLMLGDHYTSSLPKSESQARWHKKDLWANTDGRGSHKQYLEEHLVSVMEQSLKIAQQLPYFQTAMEQAQDLKTLQKKCSGKFRWQDVAVQKIRAFREQQEKPFAYFVVNMASTGCGKTFANAKIMQAISYDAKSLRYILALGLRTLTLQTGDEYRERIGLDSSELAVLIGSNAVKELHEKDHEPEPSLQIQQEALLPDELSFLDTCTQERTAFLQLFFDVKSKETCAKNAAFLYKPLLVATIDHIMGATETIRGGRFILPFLRLMSSDLVIDEIDDFGEKDLVAIARLIHLAGLLGRNVTISSATIPPDLAEGLYRAYRQGLNCYNDFFNQTKSCAIVHCDEFKTNVQNSEEMQFTQIHSAFAARRVEKLRKEPTRRRAYIAPCNSTSLGSLDLEYFDDIKKAALRLHDQNFGVDEISQKKISIGVIRVANIQPCVNLSLYLLKCDWPENYDVRLMTYHSRQILLLRHEQEYYLDAVLHRKTGTQFSDPRMRQHINSSPAENILFIVVATPVEEIGRDHDFDWAVVEPSSYRSIIQLAGRVLRHRTPVGPIGVPNIAIMQYNLKGLYGQKPAFKHPGYESNRHQLSTYDVRQLVDEKTLAQSVDAIPRIQKSADLHPETSLIDLEHTVMEDFNDKNSHGPQCVSGWNDEYWWETALPQRCNRFREQYSEDIKVYADWDDGKLVFWEVIDGNPISRGKFYNIQPFTGLKPEMESRLWLKRQYSEALLRIISDGNEYKHKDYALKYGELTFPYSDKKERKWFYSDQLGLFDNRS